MSAVGRRRVEVDDEGWIHLPGDTAAAERFDGGEQVAVAALDTRAQQVRDLECGDGRHRRLWPGLRCVDYLRAASENESENDGQPPFGPAITAHAASEAP